MNTGFRFRKQHQLKKLDICTIKLESLFKIDRKRHSITCSDMLFKYRKQHWHKQLSNPAATELENFAYILDQRMKSNMKFIGSVRSYKQIIKQNLILHQFPRKDKHPKNNKFASLNRTYIDPV